MAGIIAAGRQFIRPLYKKMSSLVGAAAAAVPLTGGGDSCCCWQPAAGPAAFSLLLGLPCPAAGPWDLLGLLGLCWAALPATGPAALTPAPCTPPHPAAQHNSDIFVATTLLVVMGTSLLTQLCGLSLALGAFLAGLLIAETEYALQVR